VQTRVFHSKSLKTMDAIYVTRHICSYTKKLKYIIIFAPIFMSTSHQNSELSYIARH
jgi:hypothetical protein